ncbi:SAM-dependent chlorinase/fluorinase [Spongiivirga sp. MCCC 1A20706]|uniref:SAM hydrolase/SAM-dependent halogenase family protein n=1 Tax=Spongiivirga sp. MCCC 1A20706 TaxID=3160963 RepID=UPI003977D018
MPTPIITLTTDFGKKDHFAGAVKGAIYKELPDAKVIDISHDVSPFNIQEAAYIIQNAYKSFPAGSIHIIGIDAELTPENRHIALKMDGHYFICANNGIVSMISSEFVAEKMVEINIHNTMQTSFTVLDVFVKVACHIARGGTLDVIGKQAKEIKQLTTIKPSINTEGNQIIGNVIYIDNYGNVVTNITRKLFDEIGKTRSFEISVRNHRFTKIYNNYSDFVNFDIPINERQVDGSGLIVFNSASFLEVAIYKSNPMTVGGASSLYALDYRDTITINFS